ncbi:MAG: DUF6111 family protein [Pseudomonadota bacterium]
MIRVFVMSALLFFLPFALFAIYAVVTDMLAAPADRGPDGRVLKSAWSRIPLAWLTGAGALLVLGTLFTLALTSPQIGAPGKTYVPPRIEDGVVVPGHVE